MFDYISQEDNVVDITQAACKVFENEYVLQNILNPILNNSELIERLRRYLRDDAAMKTNRVKPVTIPSGPKCSIPLKRLPVVPDNSEVSIKELNRTTTAIPKKDEEVERQLNVAHQNNRANAIKLLQFAKENAFRCANIKFKRPAPAVKEELYQFRHHKIPPKKSVTIKGTTASLMREAAVLIKDRESEIQKIQNLIQGGFDSNTLKNLEEVVKQCKEQEHVQDIERKHLQGLLTYEEAKLAKQNVLQDNKLKMEEFKKEQLVILQQIENWKKREQEKIQVLVEKCQNIEKAAREAEEKLLENKRMQARMVDIESKAILKEAQEERQRELAQKVKLIQELHALEQVRSLQVKEFDPTETPNFGLLCEMSIAELHERLAIIKVEIQEKLEKKRCAIIQHKNKQQEMINDMREFVARNKIPKPKPAPKGACKLEDTPEIIALRGRLERIRNDWLDKKSRTRAVKKLNAMGMCIGYSDELLKDENLENYYNLLKFIL
ncbi:hypothetical protein FQA39_LY12391 [Lamprigera yunnana]|nr:hypothetical protein FQA39_LY12391 [Lamprigera yunnana]